METNESVRRDPRKRGYTVVFFFMCLIVRVEKQNSLILRRKTIILRIL